MNEFKKELDARVYRWNIMDELRRTLDEKSENDIVRLGIETLDYSMEFLVLGKFVSHEMEGLLRKGGLLYKLEKKIEMAVVLGLLSRFDVQLFQQLGDIERASEQADKKVGIFEDEQVQMLCARLSLPPDSYLPRIVRNQKEMDIWINWNPMARSQTARERFMYVLEYLYYDLLNRSTYFYREAPEQVEEVTLPMVLGRQKSRYQAFQKDIQEREAKRKMEWMIEQNLSKSLEGMEREDPPEAEREVLEKLIDVNRDALEKLKEAKTQISKSRKQTKESWKKHQELFHEVTKQIEGSRLSKMGVTADTYN